MLFNDGGFDRLNGNLSDREPGVRQRSHPGTSDNEEVARTTGMRIDRSPPRKLRDGDCIQTMMQEGVVFDKWRGSNAEARRQLSIGNCALNRPDNCMLARLSREKRLRIWIDYEAADMHPEAGYKNGHSDSRRFAFQVATPDAPRNDAAYFFPLPLRTAGEDNSQKQRRGELARLHLSQRIVDKGKIFKMRANGQRMKC